MRAGLGTSTRIELPDAVEEAAGRALGRIGGRAPDAAIVVATAAWGAAALADLPAIVTDATRCEAIAGGSVDGLLAGEAWVSQRPALAILALADVEAWAFHAEQVASDEARVGAEWAGERIDPSHPSDLMVLFGDGLSIAPAPLLAGLADAWPGLPIVGVGASEPPGGEPVVWAGSEGAHRGCAALVLRGPRPPALAVTHGCRALGEPLEVTRARGHWVLGLSGRPALDVLRERVSSTSGGESPGDAGVLIGLLEPDAAVGPMDAPLIRNLSGVDEARSAFALAEPVRSGDRVVLLTLEQASAEREVGHRIAAAVADAGPADRTGFGLYLTCRAAGDVLLAAAARSRELAGVLDGAPLLGVSSAYQVAPTSGPSGAPRLHTYSGVVALVR